ncbi:leucine-rich repeat extensin-like protein 7 [Iris pallida]|nr:leucine-rich repeat extensin-like protein 7 [Iris pallida]
MVEGRSGWSGGAVGKIGAGRLDREGGVVVSPCPAGKSPSDGELECYRRGSGLGRRSGVRLRTPAR